MENTDYKKIGIESILERTHCNDDNVLEMIGKIQNLKTDPKVRYVSLKPPIQWYDGTGPQSYTDYTVFTDKPMSFKEQEELLKSKGLPEPAVKPGHITLVPEYNEYYKYHFEVKTKEGRNQLFVVDFHPLSHRPIKTMHLQDTRKGLYEALFHDITDGDIEMEKKIFKLGKSSKVVTTDSCCCNGFIISKYIIQKKKQLSLEQQEALLKKYGLPEPIAKPDHPDFKNSPDNAGFYFRSDDWIKIFIVKFEFTKK